VPLAPVFVIFFIGSIAETNRAPFDLAEAESELVSGFMTEHAAVIFVFFFLAEYASIVLICILNAMLFFGGYLLDLSFIYVLSDISLEFKYIVISMEKYFSVSLVEGMFYGLTMGIKSCILIFTFI
jgi:NADH-ubiquinone oxidoreductase chain 1